MNNACHGKASLLVLLDLSAAFDTVDHQLLLSDLSDRRVEGTAKSLLDLTSKTEQCVAVGDSRSEPKTLHYDVPQGCVLGPMVQYCSQYASTLFFLLEAQELVITFLPI